MWRPFRVDYDFREALEPLVASVPRASAFYCASHVCAPLVPVCNAFRLCAVRYYSVGVDVHAVLGHVFFGFLERLKIAVFPQIKLVPNKELVCAHVVIHGAISERVGVVAPVDALLGEFKRVELLVGYLSERYVLKYVASRSRCNSEEYVVVCAFIQEACSFNVVEYCLAEPLEALVLGYVEVCSAHDHTARVVLA